MTPALERYHLARVRGRQSTLVAGRIPLRPNALHRKIQARQRGLGYEEPYCLVSHVLLVSVDDIGIEMVIPWGRITEDYRTEYADSRLIYSALATGQPHHLFAAGVKEMYGRPYANLQLLGMLFFPEFIEHVYNRFPLWFRRYWEVCCEGVLRSYQRCGELLDVDADEVCPAFFFGSRFDVLEVG